MINDSFSIEIITIQQIQMLEKMIWSLQVYLTRAVGPGLTLSSDIDILTCNAAIEIPENSTLWEQDILIARSAEESLVNNFPKDNKKLSESDVSLRW